MPSSGNNVEIKTNKHKGSTLDSFLEEENILKESETVAIERLKSLKEEN